MRNTNNLHVPPSTAIAPYITAAQTAAFSFNKLENLFLHFNVQETQKRHSRRKQPAIALIPMETPSATLSPPPWEVLVLVAHHLDPKTLAIASCVSKSWSFSMSSDNLWKPILTTHFPSLSTLPPAVPYRRLFAIGHSAAKRRHQNPSKPKLSLSDLVLAISISTHESHVVTTAKPCDMLLVDPPGVFRFDVGVGCDGAAVNEGLEEVKITWNVILNGWRGVVTMMDCEGKVGFLAGGEGWFSQELPAPGCCSNGVASAVVADLKLGMCSGKGSDGKVRVNKVSVGILSVVDWRYVGVEDGLRYLQHFLLTCNALKVCN